MTEKLKLAGAGALLVALVAAGFIATTIPAESFFAVNTYWVDGVNGLDTNNGTSQTACGTNCGPWKTWAHASAGFALGSAGTVVNFLDATYIGATVTSGTAPTTCGSLGACAFYIASGGTATAPVVFQCVNGLNGNAGSPGHPGHCLLRESADAGNPEIIGTTGGNYLTIQGFDLGGDSAHPATLVQSALLIYAKDGTGNFNQVNYNYIHDVAKVSNDGNGSGNGCPSEGMVGVDMGFPATATPPPSRIPQGLKFIGNYLNNMGDITNLTCNQTHGLYVGAGPNIVVQNNIVINVPGSGIKLYASNCGSVVTNNLVIHTGWWGILADSSGQSRNDGCLGLGISPGKSTISNNIVADTGFGSTPCGAIALADGSTNNLFNNNLFVGTMNRANFPVVSCTATPVGVTNGTLSATAAATFNNFSDTPTATTDYTYKTGSVAIGGGSTACTPGGISPCVPDITLLGAVRPATPSIGPYDVAASGTAQMSVTPPTPAFANIVAGSGCGPDVVETVTNAGSAPMTINATFTITPSQIDFQKGATGTCTLGQVLNTGQNCTTSAKLCSATPGAKTATYNIFSNAPNSPIAIPLSGTVTNPGAPTNLTVTVQ